MSQADRATVLSPASLQNEIREGLAVGAQRHK
jgi:hypothetical protein